MHWLNTSSRSSDIQVIDAIGWVCVRDRQLLCVRSQDKDAFYLPGGKREPGESDWQAIAREVYEEVGLSLNPETLQPFSRIAAPAHGHGPKAQVLLICYEAEVLEDKPQKTIQPAGEIAEVAWFDSRDLAQCAPATAIVLEQLQAQGRID